MITTTIAACASCGKPLPADRKRYCSVACQADGKRVARVLRNCDRCGETFYTLPCRAAKKYCSISCRAIPDGEAMSASTVIRRRKAAGLVKPCSRHTFDESFFAEWSADLAWLVGLIWTDGCLHRRGHGVRITSKDRDLLETVKTLIGFSGPLGTRKSGAFDIVFSSKAVADRLRALGLTPAKSLTANYPEIPHEFEPDFIRGAIDGDGWVGLRKNRQGQQVHDLEVGICGAAPLMLGGLTGALDRLSITYAVQETIKPSGSPFWRIIIKRIDSLRRLHGLIYRDGCPALARKREPFNLWMATPRPRPGRRRKAA